ncbi:MAG: HpsJ-like protein, cyanoexosortase A-associated [Almyronema sp.]
MANVETEQLTQAVRQLWKSRAAWIRSVEPVHWVGYGLLLLALIDLGEILIPPVLLNPNWEFQAFGQIIERVPVALIGFAFVFLGEKEERARWELLFLPLLSWLLLLIGILYLLLIPLGIANTVRIDRQTVNQLETQANELGQQIQQARENIEDTNSTEELEQLIAALTAQSVAPDIPAGQSLPQLKDELLTSIAENEAALSSQVRENISSRRQGLLEKSIKWNLGALIAGVLYVTMWRGSRWARVRK